MKFLENNYFFGLNQVMNCFFDDIFPYWYEFFSKIFLSPRTKSFNFCYHNRPQIFKWNTVKIIWKPILRQLFLKLSKWEKFPRWYVSSIWLFDVPLITALHMYKCFTIHSGKWLKCSRFLVYKYFFNDKLNWIAILLFWNRTCFKTQFNRFMSF